MFGLNWKWLLAVVLPLFLLFGGGCVARGALQGGKATIHYQPGFGIVSSTWFLFNRADRNLVEIEDAEASGEAETRSDVDDGE